MAIKEIVKGICSLTRCKYDVYTKEKTDELLESKANISDVNAVDSKIVTLTASGTVNSESNICGIKFNYPEGFNKDNTMVLSVMYETPFLPGHYQYNHHNYDTNSTANSSLAILEESYIGVDLNCGLALAGETVNAKITLLKL